MRQLRRRSGVAFCTAGSIEPPLELSGAGDLSHRDYVIPTRGPSGRVSAGNDRWKEESSRQWWYAMWRVGGWRLKKEKEGKEKERQREREREKGKEEGREREKEREKGREKVGKLRRGDARVGDACPESDVEHARHHPEPTACPPSPRCPIWPTETAASPIVIPDVNSIAEKQKSAKRDPAFLQLAARHRQSQGKPSAAAFSLPNLQASPAWDLDVSSPALLHAGSEEDDEEEEGRRGGALNGLALSPRYGNGAMGTGLEASRMLEASPRNTPLRRINAGSRGRSSDFSFYPMSPAVSELESVASTWQFSLPGGDSSESVSSGSDLLERGSRGWGEIHVAGETVESFTPSERGEREDTRGREGEKGREGGRDREEGVTLRGAEAERRREGEVAGEPVESFIPSEREERKDTRGREGEKGREGEREREERVNSRGTEAASGRKGEMEREEWEDIRGREAEKGREGEGGRERERGDREHSRMEHYVALLRDGKSDERKLAVWKIRGLIKNSAENKARLVAANGIPPLVALLEAADIRAVEDAVTVILNVSRVPRYQEEVVATGGIDALVEVLNQSGSGGNFVAMENAAAALFTLSQNAELRLLVWIAGAVKPLVKILKSESVRAKKDASLALFSLSLHPGCAKDIVNLGAVPRLLGLATDPELEEKAVAVLANLARTASGRLAIVKGSGIPVLVEVLEGGPLRAKEDAVSALLGLALHVSSAPDLMLKEGVMPPLVSLSEGSVRGRGEAKTLIQLLRNRLGRVSGRSLVSSMESGRRMGSMEVLGEDWLIMGRERGGVHV